MKKDPRIFLEHMLQSIALIEDYVRGRSLAEFVALVSLQDQVLRRIEIIGEAARNLPEDLKSRYPEVPWQRMTAMRNILIHAYFGVDLELAWKVATDEVATLKQNLLRIRNELG